MQREIKFRFWDSVDNKMMDSSDIDSSLYFPSFEPQLSIGRYLENGDWEQDLPIMQYTGFKDKNGKEIFEGDILSCKVWIDGKWEDSKEPVIFRDGCFCLDWSFQKDGSYYEILSKEIEGKSILGNIYENPELITRAVGV